MNRSVFLKVLTVASMLVAAPVMADIKIAVVDFAEVAAKSPQSDAINEKLKKEFNDRIENMKKLQQELKTMQEKLQKDAHLSEDAAKDAEEDIQANTDKFISLVEKHLEAKEKEIMAV